MAFEPMYDYFKADRLGVVGSQQIGVTARMKAQEEEEIDRVLCVEASAMIGGGEALAGEARYNGIATFKVMYVTAAGNVEYMSYDAEFSGRIEDSSITPKTVPQFTCKVMDTDTGSVSKVEINVSAALEISLAAVLESEVKYLSGVGEGMYTREDEVCYSCVTATVKQALTVSGDAEVKDILKGVLLTACDSCVLNASAGLDCFVVEGEVYTTVSYKTDADECAVKCVDFAIPFKEELTAPGAMVGQKVCTSSMVKNVKVTAEVDEETAKTRIFVEAEVLITGRSYAEEKLLVVSDVFSPQHNLGIEYTGYETMSLSDTVCSNEKISGSFELEEGNEVDKILGISTRSVAVSGSYCKDGRAVVEGVVTCCAMCTHNDRIKSIEIETPFSVSMKCAAGEESAKSEATAAVSSITARHKKTNEIDLTIQLEVRADLYQKMSGSVISAMEITGEKPMCTAAMQIYCPKPTETLWDISKELSVQPDLIMAQNPGLKFPLTGGERILIYRQNKAKF